jgi:lactoylglutathione lyase
MKFLHTMVRVTNLERSIQFYTELLGLKLHKRTDYPEGKFTLVFLGGEPDTESFLELTHNWDVKQYDLGTGYGHVAFGVEDIYATCENIQKMGGKVTRPPGPMKHGNTIIAFVEDPDGYKIELIHKR